MKTRYLVSCCILLLLFVVMAADPLCAAGEEKPIYADPAARKLALKKAMSKLVEQKKGATCNVLDKQLVRASCSCTLPISGIAIKLEPAALYEHCRDGVVVIGKTYLCEKCSNLHVGGASGFAISKDGKIVTNHHVVESKGKYESLAVMTHDGKVYGVKEVLAANSKDDVAILQLADASNMKYLPLAKDCPVGSRICVISHPRGQFYLFTQGTVSGYFLDKHGKNDKVKRMSVTADFGSGSSGGPILDEYGRVVGIVASTQSVLADKHSVDSYAQMVVRKCVPSKAIFDLVEDAEAQEEKDDAEDKMRRME